MQSQLNPYIGFKDNAREAMEFYKGIFGGKLEMHTFDEYDMPGQDPAEAKKIMHAMLQADNGITFMAADTPSIMGYRPGANVSMSLSGDNDQELSAYFDALAEGGSVNIPLDQAPWGDKFGMLTDKFGINWMVNIAGSKA
jgi:PhnB protein